MKPREAVDTPLVVMFVDDDESYLRWLEANSHGYVVNCHHSPTPDYLTLHHARCSTIRGKPARGDTWTCGDYAKVCADGAGPLNAWALTNYHTYPKPCGLCGPW